MPEPAKEKINVWQYSRWVYLIGRSVKFRGFQKHERDAIALFLDGMLKKRPGIFSRFNIKRGNAVGYSGETVGEALEGAVAKKEYVVASDLAKQNDHSVGKMLQVIGRDMKAKFPVDGEKALCDALFLKTDKRRYQSYGNYTAPPEVPPVHQEEGPAPASTPASDAPSDEVPKKEVSESAHSVQSSVKSGASTSQASEFSEVNSGSNQKNSKADGGRTI